MSYKPCGVTVLINLWHLGDHLLTHSLAWKKIASDLVIALGLTPVPETYTVKNFRDNKLSIMGFTFTMILKESHIAGHTWGEHNYMRLELSSCKLIDIDALREYLYDALPVATIQIQEITW